MKSLPPAIEAQRAAWAEALDAAGLAARSPALLRLSEVGVALVPSSRPPAAGGTCAGGDPDVEEGDDEWPEGCSFVAQIDLADLAWLKGSPLPRKGLLQLYVVNGEDEDGDYLATGYCHYVRAGAPLVKLSAESGARRWPARSLDVGPLLTMPHPDSSGLDRGGSSTKSSSCTRPSGGSSPGRGTGCWATAVTTTTTPKRTRSC
jgi:hypothetical protein